MSFQVVQFGPFSDGLPKMGATRRKLDSNTAGRRPAVECGGQHSSALSRLFLSERRVPLCLEHDDLVSGHGVGSRVGSGQRAVPVHIERDGGFQQDVRSPEPGQVLDMLGLDQDGPVEISLGQYGGKPLLTQAAECRIELQVGGSRRAVGPIGHTSSLIRSRRSSRCRGRPLKSLNVISGSMPRCR